MSKYVSLKFSAEERARLFPDSSQPHGPDGFIDQADAHDPVARPAHYLFDDGVEVIALTEQLNFNRGNAVKYTARAGRKGTPMDEIQDIDKAIWYLQRERARLQRRAL